MTNKESKETKVRVTDYKDAHFSKVSKVHVTNKGEGGEGNGGEFDGTISWDNVTDKPDSFPPSDHDHDTRYYTKEEINSPEFLSDRVDNITVALEGRELKVRNVDGLEIGIVDINEWLAGTEGNIQDQLNTLGESIVNMVSGMEYTGFEESYADLTQRQNASHGDFVFVLNDENKDNVRSIRIYNENLGKWDYIGPLTASTKFTEMSDTPSGYDSGKYLKSSSSGIVYEDVDYQTLKNKPSSTITEIDDAVTKRHEHSNGGTLDEVGVSDNGILTYKGEEYVRKIDLAAQAEKEYFFAARSGTSQSINSDGATLIFNSLVSSRGGISYNTSNGIFTLTPGKVYRITVNVSFLFRETHKSAQLAVRSIADGTNYLPRGIVHSSSNTSDYSPTNGLERIVTATPTNNTFSIAKLTSTPAFMEANSSSLIVQEL